MSMPGILPAHRPWESHRSCAKKGPVVRHEGPGCGRMGCVCHAKHVPQCPERVWSMVNTVRSFAWNLKCIRALSLAHCSSSWCSKCCRTSSALVYHGNCSMWMTWCSARALRRCVYPHSRHYKDRLSRCVDLRDKEKTALRPWHHYHVNPYIGKTFFSYWDGSQVKKSMKISIR